MPRIVCGACVVPLRISTNVYFVNEGALWESDEYTCPECGVAVLSGFFGEPIARGEAMEKWVKRIKEQRTDKLRVRLVIKGDQ